MVGYFSLLPIAYSYRATVRIIATVNVTSETSRAKMKSWFEKWQAERKRRRDNGEPAMVSPQDWSY